VYGGHAGGPPAPFPSAAAVIRNCISSGTAAHESGWARMSDRAGSPAGPPAGWYLDPGRQDKLRWWDGSRWGEQTQPVSPPPAMQHPGVTHAQPDYWTEQPQQGYRYAPAHDGRAPRRNRRGLRITLAIIGGLAVLIIIRIISGILTAGGGSGNSAAEVPACSSHHSVSSQAWLEIVKNPDGHVGQCLIVYGEVTQFDSATGTTEFRANAGGVHQSPQYGFVNYPTNTLFSGTASKLNAVVEGDVFSAEVTVLGHVDYNNTFGGSTSAPLLRVDSIRATGHLSVP
jgi:Protein of unknown function (DUF2510)